MQEAEFAHTLTVSVEAALADLDDATVRMTQLTTPNTPTPRPKFYRITHTIQWPFTTIGADPLVLEWRGMRVHSANIYISSPGQRDDLARHICNSCNWIPGRVVGAVRRIRAAAAWCEARRDGRQRSAQAIVNQSMIAMERLEANVTLATLREDENQKPETDDVNPEDIPF